MKAATVEITPVEKLVLLACALVWRVIRLFDPYRIQRHFAAKPGAESIAMAEVYSLPEKDAVNHIARLNNNRMSGMKRGDLIKVVNADNGSFVMRYVHGAGEHKIRYNSVGLDYDAKRELGILDSEQANLLVCKANAADREFYLMYQDKSVSSRQSRALGWYVLLGGMVFGFVWQAIGFVADLALSLI